ncbi:hypothetical protein LIA77_12002 [Sarocladium implicatum]|nr:hypothetical protein LIA77_12002 [Sarocladium implicatum]
MTLPPHSPHTSSSPSTVRSVSRRVDRSSATDDVHSITSMSPRLGIESPDEDEMPRREPTVTTMLRSRRLDSMRAAQDKERGKPVSVFNESLRKSRHKNRLSPQSSPEAPRDFSDLQSYRWTRLSESPSNHRSSPDMCSFRHEAQTLPRQHQHQQYPLRLGT